MGYFINNNDMNSILADMEENYAVYAPKLTKQRVNGKAVSTVRYGRINSVEDIIYNRKSDFSPKEVVYPVSQTMFYFEGSEVIQKELDDERKIIIFLRACDIHGMKRLDQVFIGNGIQPDLYYKRLRDKVKFVLMECENSFDRCYCVSMGTNVAEDYDAAVRFTEEGLLLDVKDEELKKLFAGAGAEKEFTPAYVTENPSAMTVPDISDRGLLPAIIASEYWRQFDEKCIACGGCNTVCPTCSCFDTSDIIYQETDTSGERKRTWGSCMLDSFTVMAGGASVRKCHGDNMRFKILHKMYDFNARFKNGHMCVGCGRCDARCPEDIHFSEVVKGLAEVVENIKKEAAKEA